MDTLFALVALGFGITYVVVLIVALERGKSWAREVVRAISLLDPGSAYGLSRDSFEPVDRPAAPEDPGAADKSDPETGRLAA